MVPRSGCVENTYCTIQDWNRGLGEMLDVERWPKSSRTIRMYDVQSKAGNSMEEQMKRSVYSRRENSFVVATS